MKQLESYLINWWVISIKTCYGDQVLEVLFANGRNGPHFINWFLFLTLWSLYALWLRITFLRFGREIWKSLEGLCLLLAQIMRQAMKSKLRDPVFSEIIFHQWPGSHVNYFLTFSVLSFQNTTLADLLPPRAYLISSDILFSCNIIYGWTVFKAILFLLMKKIQV